MAYNNGCFYSAPTQLVKKPYDEMAAVHLLNVPPGMRGESAEFDLVVVVHCEHFRHEIPTPCLASDSLSDILSATYHNHKPTVATST